MNTLGVTLQCCAVGFVAAWVLAWYPPDVGEALWEIPHGWLPAVDYLSPAEPAAVPVAWVDPARADFTSDGIGALSSIADTPEDPGLISERERQAAVDAWVHDTVTVSALDWSGVDAALQRFLAPLDRVERLHVEVDSAMHGPAVVPSWRTAGTLEHTGEIHLSPELIGVFA